MYESAFSLPRLTAAIISRALSRLRVVRLPDSLDADLLNTCLFMNKSVFPSICELEPGERDDVDGPAPVLIDATGYHRNTHDKEIRLCEALINDLEPGYLRLGPLCLVPLCARAFRSKQGRGITASKSNR